MTTFEHALLGINGALAAGLYRKYGWQICAMAGLAAVSPDWDGLPILFDGPIFAMAHRVWGHNLLVCPLVGAAIGLLDWRVDFTGRSLAGLARLVRLWDVVLVPRNRQPNATAAVIWTLTGCLAALSHLPADLIVSGSAEFPDWEVKLFWPFSQQGYIFPWVRWGDVGVSCIFVLGMFAMVRWRNHARAIAVLTLAAVICYCAIRGLIGRIV